MRRSIPARAKALATAAAAAVACAPWAAGCGGTGTPVASVVLVTVDTLRPDHLSYAGYSRPTSPTLDAMAAGGLVFERARSHAPVTAPAHASILTGRLPAWHLVLTNGDVLNDGVDTLAELLAAAGFRTAAFVSNFTITRLVNFQQGFAHYDDSLPQSEQNRPQPERIAEHTVDAALTWLAQHRRERFFCWIHLQDPHGPYAPPPAYGEAFAAEARARPPLLLPLLEDQSGFGGIPSYQALDGERNANAYVAGYDGEIRYMDAQLGRVIEALRGWRVDPFFVITADHGEALGEHGYYFAHGQGLTEDQIRVPLLLSGPGVPAGIRSTLAVQHVDIVPTILARAGVPIPKELPGRDLLALVAEPRREERPLVAQAFPEEWAVVEAGKKLIVWPNRKALYDLDRDPAEARDVAAGEPAVSDALGALLEAERAKPPPPWPRTPAQRDLLRSQLRALGYID
jgi:arylsulfatase A-like enzyme